MNIKSTEELTNEIKAATDIEDYLITNQNSLLSTNFSEYLKDLLLQKKISRTDVIRDSLLDRVYVYQIFSGRKTASRDKLIAMAFGMHLSDEETQKMLKFSGNRELYSRDKRDALILFALFHQKSIHEANELLFDHNFSPLGI